MFISNVQERIQEPREEGRRWQAEANPSCPVAFLPHPDLFTWKTARATLRPPERG